MLLSNNNIIKSDNIERKGKISITKNFIKEEVSQPQIEKFIQNIEVQINKNKEIASQILQDAELEKQKIIEEALKNAKEIEEKAYNEGYTQGVKNGYEDGYKESYEENIEKAKEEIVFLKNEANKTIQSANEQLVEYMKTNETKILQLSINIAEQILREKCKSSNSINNLVKHAISEQEICETYIIKCSEVHSESLKNELDVWKHTLVKTPNIFILVDNEIEEGNVVIEKDNGRIILGLECGLEKIKNEVLGL